LYTRDLQTAAAKDPKLEEQEARLLARKEAQAKGSVVAQFAGELTGEPVTTIDPITGKPVLSKRYLAMAKALLDLCDVDGSNSIEMGEFVQVCLEYTPDVQEEQIIQTFKIVGAEDNVIDLDEFGSWVALMFSECGEQDFLDGMIEFEEATSKVRATLNLPSRFNSE